MKYLYHLAFFLIPYTLYLFPLSTQAKVQIPSIFSDHAVLQQNAMAPIWGRAEPGEVITIVASWDPMQLSTYADSKGLWRMDLPTSEAGGPFQIIIKGTNTIILNDIWLGEVWIASGQSNMHWPLKRSDEGETEIPKADFPGIRLFQVEREVSTTPRFDCKGEWKLCQPETAADFSAIAYYFGKELHELLNVPIGLVQTTWGGTPAEAWTSREMLTELDAFMPYLDEFDDAMRRYRANPRLPDPVYQRSPTVLFNAMLHPLIPYAMQGVIWYQGEGNVSDPYLYRQLFPAMIQDWRRRWGWRFSFYFVQLAPYMYTVPQSGAGLREAQLLSMNMPNTGMAVTMDVGNPFDIHPTDKRTVGHRLAQWALHNNYHRADVTPSGPLLQRMEKQGDLLRLRFLYASGLRDGGGALKAFEVAGPDQTFYPAIARIEGETIVLRSSEVSNPIAARYAFADTSQAALYNEAGLPASSFRTDDWVMFFNRPTITAQYNKETDEFYVSMEYRQILNHNIHYTLDGTTPTTDSPVYDAPLTLQGPLNLRAQVFIDGKASPYEAKRVLRKHLAMGKTILDAPKVTARFSGNLLDGLHGTENFRDGAWFGVRGKDMSVTIDLGEKMSIKQVETRFLQEHGRGILLPKEIQYEVSVNGTKFKSLKPFPLGIPPKELPRQIRMFTTEWKPVKARYIRMTFQNPGPLPAWHPNAGNASLVLLDEIVVE